VRKKPLIPPAPFDSKDLSEDQFIHFVPEQVIRKRLWVTACSLCEPLDRLISEFVQMPRAQAVFAGQEEVAVLRTERIIHRWTYRMGKSRGGRFAPALARKERWAMRKSRQELHMKGRGPVTLPHRLHELLLSQAL